MKLRVGMVAGEASGDLLGANIIQGLRQLYPEIEVEGVAGPQMQAAGAKTLFPMEKLSVMGFSEVLWRARELLSLRRQIKQHFLRFPPDVYIGIDSPDFNLPIETVLKAAGITTVHCNSPTIWAWRKKRIFKIARAVNLMLVLFPFEPVYYEAQNIPVRYIGHPLADQIPLKSDVLKARQDLHLPSEKKVIALLPGSRQGEIKYIGPLLLQAAKRWLSLHPEYLFVSPMANDACFKQFERQWRDIAPDLPLTLVRRQTQRVMAAADLIVLASGTATLEAMLIKRPMVVVYRGSALSYFIAKQLVTIRQFSLPNILADKLLVPELIQYQATPENLVRTMDAVLANGANHDALMTRFTAIHQQLRCGAAQQAAMAIRDLLREKFAVKFS